MKTILGLLLLSTSITANAGTCDLLSGSFKATWEQCYHIRDGVKYQDEVMELSMAYNESTKYLGVIMTSRNYALNYLADGNEHAGNPNFEGNKYTAQCDNNHARIRAEFTALRRPLIHDYSINSQGKLIFRESFEGDNSFVRVCEMDRI